MCSCPTRIHVLSFCANSFVLLEQDNMHSCWTSIAIESLSNKNMRFSETGISIRLNKNMFVFVRLGIWVACVVVERKHMYSSWAEESTCSPRKLEFVCLLTKSRCIIAGKDHTIQFEPELRCARCTKKMYSCRTRTHNFLVKEYMQSCWTIRHVILYNQNIYSLVNERHVFVSGKKARILVQREHMESHQS